MSDKKIVFVVISTALPLDRKQPALGARINSVCLRPKRAEEIAKQHQDHEKIIEGIRCVIHTSIIEVSLDES